MISIRLFSNDDDDGDDDGGGGGGAGEGDTNIVFSLRFCCGYRKHCEWKEKRRDNRDDFGGKDNDKELSPRLDD